MAEEVAVGCARPTGGPVGEENKNETPRLHEILKEEHRALRISGGGVAPKVKGNFKFMEEEVCSVQNIL